MLRTETHLIEADRKSDDISDPTNNRLPDNTNSLTVSLSYSTRHSLYKREPRREVLFP